MPEFDDMVLKLKEIRPDWDWREDIDPWALSTGAPLSRVASQGIYNRAVIVVAERSQFTIGLEAELNQLAQRTVLHGTALGAWVSGGLGEPGSPEDGPLIEVLALNSEQRDAVVGALSKPLTIVTGPPGTGKSQVVSEILINAAWRGERVLFASKNNKAVNVVETRVNALGSRPVLLRLGSADHRAALARYLETLLSASARADDASTYERVLACHRDVCSRLADLRRETAALVGLRNKVDELEQASEKARMHLGEHFAALVRSDPRTAVVALGDLREAVNRAIKAGAGRAAKVIWPLLRRRRRTRALSLAAERASELQFVGLGPESMPRVDAPEPDWQAFAEDLAVRSSAVSAAAEYSIALAALSGAQSLEDLAGQALRLGVELGAASSQVWNLWTTIQPARLSQSERHALGNLCSTIQMLVQAGQNRAPSGVWRQYNELFPRALQVLGCWAVTSLSARGRLPLEPGMFDLLVIDEASQCDIASALPLLYRARRAVIIGDPQQLRHISGLAPGQDQLLLAKYGLGQDRATWAYSVNSLFDLARSLVPSDGIVVLKDHHRSHADIISFSNDYFYRGDLRIATRYDRLKLPAPQQPAVRWIPVRGETTRPPEGGAMNRVEAERLVQELRRLAVEQGYLGTIGVVTPFRAQVGLIRELVSSDEGLSRALERADFLVDTVHAFQGDERDVMMFSPVVSDGTGSGPVRFLNRNPNLFNVAVTRARSALLVVGDDGACSRLGIVYLHRFSEHARRLIRSGQPPVETPAPGPEYPAVARPELVSDWERLFYRMLFAAGIRTIPQYPVEHYLLDLAVVDGDRRLDIEVDGERYHRAWDGELCRRDQLRSQRLIELGWDIYRFWVYEIRDEPGRCVQRVRDWLQRGQSRQAPGGPANQ